NPLAAALLALLALTLAGGFSAVTALWLRAARQARRAEVSVGHDRRMMHDYFARVSGDLRLQQPGAPPLRQGMAEAALAYLTDYQSVLREQGDEPGTRAELSRTYWCMGELMRLLGPADDALPNLKQAAALQEQLLAADPGGARLREDLAHSYASLGNLHTGRGRHEEALRSLRHALDVLDPLAGAGAGDGPTPASAREVLAGVYGQLGLLHARDGRAPEALAGLRRARGGGAGVPAPGVRLARAVGPRAGPDPAAGGGAGRRLLPPGRPAPERGGGGPGRGTVRQGP